VTRGERVVAIGGCWLLVAAVTFLLDDRTGMMRPLLARLGSALLLGQAS
jgi:hypothetical protein